MVVVVGIDGRMGAAERWSELAGDAPCCECCEL